MTILGIDPGNTFSAAAVLADGKLLSSCRLPNAEFLEWLQIKKITHESFNAEPLRVACEMIAAMGMAVGREVFDTVRMIGRIEAIFPDLDLITRVTIKNEICGSSKARDANVRQALIDIYGPPGSKKAPGGTFGVSKDIWAALAVATAASRGCKLYETKPN